MHFDEAYERALEILHNRADLDDDDAHELAKQAAEMRQRGEHVDYDELVEHMRPDAEPER